MVTAAFGAVFCFFMTASVFGAKFGAPQEPSPAWRYGRIANAIGPCNPLLQAIAKDRFHDNLSPNNLLCFSGLSLSAADPTLNRPSTSGSGNGFLGGTCALNATNTAVRYDAHYFNISGCAVFPTVVRITACGTGGCAAAGNTDSLIILYRNVAAGDPLTANGGLPSVFNPASPCTNAQGLNDDLDTSEVITGGSSCNQTVTSDCLATCTGNTSVPGMKRNLGNGRFTVVVAGFGNGTIGNYNLTVDAPAAGCSVAIAPSAAGVLVAGRVMTAEGNGVVNAIVVATDQQGVSRQARTGSFGYYSIDELPAGETYVISVISKRFLFTPRAISASDNVTDFDFIANWN